MMMAFGSRFGFRGKFIFSGAVPGMELKISVEEKLCATCRRKNMEVLTFDFFKHVFQYDQEILNLKTSLVPEIKLSGFRHFGMLFDKDYQF